MSAEKLIHICIEKNFTLATAESCTGGGLGAALTSVSGASKAYLGGFVTYSNEAKIALLGVEKALILKHGAVSSLVATAMAQGAIERVKADYAVAITGIAGPKSDDTLKPVGLVFIAFATRQTSQCKEFNFGDIGRENVREKAIEAAIDLVYAQIRPKT